MSDGELIGRDFQTNQVVKISWREGCITSYSPVDAKEECVGWIAPPLFDMQINGYGGIDFQQDTLTESELLTSVKALYRDGCTHFLLTLITDKWDALIRRLRHLRQIRSRCPELLSAIAGWHIEGPFLSRKSGFHGTHNPECMLNPTVDLLDELRHTVPGDPLLITLAPELPGSIEAIKWAVTSGMTVSVGHTDAPQEVLSDAVKAGATGFTHLGNGCPSELNRHDNILWRVFETPNLVVSLIPDQIHISPALFRLIHRVMPPERIVYISDAMAAGGAPPGTYPLGALRLMVGPDEVVKLPEQSNYAGSALRPITAIHRAGAMLGCNWKAAWRMYSTQPKQYMNILQPIELGKEATFCYYQPGKVTDGPGICKVYVRGTAVA